MSSEAPPSPVPAATASTTRATTSAKETRQAFFRALRETDSHSPLLAFVSLHRGKRDEFALDAFFDALTSRKREECWALLLKRLQVEFESGVFSVGEETSGGAGGAAAGDEEEEDSSLMVPGDASARATVLELIDGVVLMAHEFVANEGRAASKSLLATMELLHDNLFLLPKDAEASKNGIARVCEMWWRQKRRGREALLPQTLVYLMMRLCDPTARKADIKRVLAMRDGFELVDFADPSAETLEHLILRCTVHPLCLRQDEGSKLLAFFFTLHVPLMQHMHLAIKNQLPTCRESLLVQYGKLFVRAWRLTSGQHRVSMELSCVQDLMHCAIHASQPKTAKAVRTVLDQFHEAKHTRGVGSMLCRLYAPVLWRALSVANPLVRRNAVPLFSACFPLINTSSPRSERDKAIQDQVDRLQALLVDRDDEVRRLAVHAVCRAVGMYWELFQLPSIKMLLGKLINDLVHDASSANVRVAVFAGLTFILDNELSHAVLKPALPQLAPLVHDKAEKVRVAVIDMLLEISKKRTIRFFDVVKVDDLLLRLATDKPRVAKRITALLLHSYFPHTRKASKQLERAILLINDNHAAAMAFFQNVHHFVPAGDVCKLTATMYHAIVLAADLEVPDDAEEEDEEEAEEEAEDAQQKKGKAKKRAKRGKNASEEDEEEAAQPEPSAKKRKLSKKSKIAKLVSVDNVPLIEALLDAMGVLWSSVQPVLKQKVNRHLAEFMQSTFSDGNLQALLAMFKSERARAAVMTLASRVPAEYLPELSATVVPQLTALSDESPVSSFGPLLLSLVRWGMVGAFLVDINEALQEALPTDTKSKKKRARGNKAQQNTLSPSMAVRYLAYLVAEPATRDGVLEEREACDQLLDTLRRVTTIIPQYITEYVDPTEDPKRDDLLLSAFQMHCRLELHIAAHKHGDDSKPMPVPEPISNAFEMISADVVTLMTSYATYASATEQEKEEEQDDDQAERTSKRRRRTRTGKRGKEEADEDDDLAESQPVRLSLAHRLVVFGTQLADNLVHTNVHEVVFPGPYVFDWVRAVVASGEAGDSSKPKDTTSERKRRKKLRLKNSLQADKSPFLAAFLPRLYKLAFRLAQHAANDRVHGSSYLAQVQGLLTEAIKLSNPGTFASPNSFARSALDHTLRAHAGKASITKVVLVLLASILFEESSSPQQPPPQLDEDEDENMTPSSHNAGDPSEHMDEADFEDEMVEAVEEMDPVWSFVLGALARSPAAVHAMPEVVTSVAMHKLGASMSDAVRMRRLLGLLSGLRAAGEDLIKATSRRAEFLSVLGQSAQRLASLMGVAEGASVKQMGQSMLAIPDKAREHAAVVAVRFAEECEDDREELQQQAA